MLEGILELVLMLLILSACVPLIRLFAIANRLGEIVEELRGIRELMQKK